MEPKAQEPAAAAAAQKQPVEPMVFDKEQPEDHVTVSGAKRTSKSFREPQWGT